MKESCGGWLFWGDFMALPHRAACMVWFVERLKWSWLVEQRLALDLHTLLNHTDSRLQALPTALPQTQIYLQAGATPDSEPYGSDYTQPSAGFQLQPAVDNGGCCATTASKWFPDQDCTRGYWTKPQAGRENWWQRKERGSEGAVGQVAIVCGGMDKSPWLKAQRLSVVPSPWGVWMLSFQCGKTIICLNEPVLCLCMCMCVFGRRMHLGPCRKLHKDRFSHKIMKQSFNKILLY